MKNSGFKRPVYQRPPVSHPQPISRGVVSRCDALALVQPKPEEHRNPHLLSMARGKPCLFRLPGICTDNRATVVACHQNEGKGMAIKQNDHMSAAGCFACHTAYDQGPTLREVKREWFHVAHGRQILDWRRIVGDMSYTPRDRKAAHWALCLLESEPNQPPAQTVIGQAAINSGA